MPTFREDLHLGHKVPTVETDDIVNHAVTEEKLADDSVSTRTIQDGAVTEPKLADKSVSTRTLQDKSVTAEKIGCDVVHKIIRPITDDLQNQIDSLEVAGVAVSNMFGDNKHISVSQKALTAAFDKIWSKLEEMTGEVLRGISLSVSPSYYIGENGCDVHITAETTCTCGMFEELRLYLNDILIAEAEDTSFFEYDAEINETAVIRVEAQIMGVTYTEQKAVIHNSSFWLGAGTSFADIMNNGHLISTANGMRGAYDISVNAGDHIYVVIASTLRPGFIRADINGAEIPLDETTVTLNGISYSVFTSLETYNAGTINIDING